MAREGWTAYQFAQHMAKHGVSDQAAYRLVRAGGKLKKYDARLLAALCDVFGIKSTDLRPLFTRDDE